MGMLYAFFALGITLVADAFIIATGHGKAPTQAGVGGFRVRAIAAVAFMAMGLFFAMMFLGNPNLP